MDSRSEEWRRDPQDAPPQQETDPKKPLWQAVLLMIACAMIGTSGDPALPQSVELRFYSDRLQVQTARGSVVCPRGLLSLKLDKAHLTVTAPQQRWELPLKDFDDPSALRRFLTGQD